MKLFVSCKALNSASTILVNFLHSMIWSFPWSFIFVNEKLHFFNFPRNTMKISSHTRFVLKPLTTWWRRWSSTSRQQSRSWRKPKKPSKTTRIWGTSSVHHILDIRCYHGQKWSHMRRASSNSGLLTHIKPSLVSYSVEISIVLLCTR